MSDPDLTSLLQRLDRIDRAVELGCAVSVHENADVMRRALVDTASEAVRVGHQVTALVAYGDLWSELPALISRWARIEALCALVATVEASAQAEVDAASTTLSMLRGVHSSASTIDAAGVELSAHPRDKRVAARLAIAIRDLEQFADQHFVAALHGPDHGLDAAMALLTTCAARGSRERMAARSRRGA